MSLELAKQFHDAYERLAPQFGYETREDTKEFDPDSPNGKLMAAVCKEVVGNRIDALAERLEVAADKLTEYRKRIVDLGGANVG